jgi:periplasmic protein TonB
MKPEISLPSIVAAAIWTSCLAIGVIGIVIPYARPVLAKKEERPLQAQLLNVELTTDPIPPLETSAPPPEILTPPAISEPVAPPSAPALIPVAAPSSAIAFAVPVAGPTRVVTAEQASYAIPMEVARAEAPAPVVKQLTFGHGEGKQPIEYPARAESEGQEGIVRILFTVGVDGRTVSAEIASRSPWPLLNEAALKAVRERWRFKPGPIRRYEVPINFKLRK